MSKTYITLTGTQYYHGKDFLKPGMRVQLVKEPDNKYDKEAIVVRLEGLGDIGHVANSVHTVVDEASVQAFCMIVLERKPIAKVMYVMPTRVICRVSKRDLER